MDDFCYLNDALHCEGLPAATLAERFGTPLYVYSRATLSAHYDRLRDAFTELDPLICYSIKSCPNLAICRLLRERGSGFDVVSGGELFRALRVGADPARIVFAGVGKRDEEIREALTAGVGLLNVESPSELEQLARIAREVGVSAAAALRINPDVDAHTHAYTTTGKKETKFGVDWAEARALFARARALEPLRLRGLHLHIGSPVNDAAPYRVAITRALELTDALRRDGFTLDTLDIGGGFGAFYAGGEAPAASDYAREVAPLLRGRDLRIILEPGRSICGNGGILLTRVLHIKKSGEKRFVVVDASMNELIRPALYGAYHFMWPVDAAGRAPRNRAAQQPFEGLSRYDVVGPVCESGDFLAKDRLLPPLERGALLAVFTAGAYGMSMSSQYNSRPRAAEVLVEAGTARLIRRRETYGDLVACEVDE